ncbi:hypothetical protein QE361_003148 [Sphingomonas sp. SORGH_AS802]|uniref:flagellar hook-length control protein FliK n=1 Tax=unclassified Sphingomonas TaxID=196159 RepID=UPI00285FAB92|nr:MULTISPECIES: flagellar hook-length control protein FliK [unclassified Sphingomonas]MDR6128840.1 hypothetical protein [Sphingomonas sp. SORGH_AS_0438]MDR6136147.1 hypothetical protein [Sphingomonas sp. SORGH_AS_0802]
MIQIAAPATNVPNPAGRPAPVAAGAGLLAFLLPGGEAGGAPAGVTGGDAMPGERQEDAAPGSDLPEGATDDLRFLAAMLPGVPLPVAPEEKASLPSAASGPVATPVSATDRSGPKAERWTLPAISTVGPQAPVVAPDAVSPTPLPDVVSVRGEVPAVPTAPAMSVAPIPTAPVSPKTQAPDIETAVPIAWPAVPAPAMPAVAAPAAPSAAVVMAARTMVADAIRAGVRIETVPLPAAPVLPLAPVALPANWQAQAAPVVALAGPVPLAAATPMPVATDAAPVAPLPAEGGIDAAHPVMPNRIDQHAAPLPQAQPVPPAVPDPAAAPVFAAAVTAATQPAGKDRDPAAPTDPLAAIAPAAATPSVVAVAPPSSGERSMLDLTQERWPQAMVAHIERLRDAADAADTRIRLVPDALGAIDIGVRQEGETLHVHFTAAEAQTRSLLQEAQPRLAEAAEQRGLKLGQTSVGQNQAEAGSGQRQPQPQSQHQAAPSPRPASPHRTASARDGDDDARLA